MSLVRIDLAKGHPEGFGRAVGEIVCRAMMSEVSVPIDDKFQIITTHEATEINIPASYLEIEYSPGIIFNIRSEKFKNRGTRAGAQLL